MTPPFLTLFTLPKPSGGPDSHVGIIQRNAITSWSKLPGVDVVVVGAEDGIAALAQQAGARHLSDVDYNDRGTPLVSSAFDAVRASSETPLLAYCNSDVILLPDFVDSVKRLYELKSGGQFVAFGRRIDLRVDDRIDFESSTTWSALADRAATEGRVATQVCKEYFVFNRQLYDDMPPFAIGRGNWDNWMIWSAKQKQWPVVNVSQSVTAIHQAHDYRHSCANRRSVYMTGHEAKENQRLAGGRHWFTGSIGTQRLTTGGLEQEKPFLVNSHFWADIPRFLRLVAGLWA